MRCVASSMVIISCGGQVKEGPTGKGHRAKNSVCYDEDVVTERQWSKAVDNEDDVEELESAKRTKKHGRQPSNPPNTPSYV